MFKNSIGNVALLSIDNFPQHLNAVHVFFLSQTLEPINAVLYSQIPYGTTVHEKTKIVDPLYLIIMLLPLSPVHPAKQPLSREIRTLHQVYPMNCTDISTLLSTR